MSAQSGFASLAREGGRGALVTVLRGPGAGGKLLVRADGSDEGDLGPLQEPALRHADELMWAERSEAREEGGSLLFVDVTYPAPRIIIFGAVDFAAALVRLARTIGWRPYVIDPRSRFATKERFPEAEDVVAAWPAQAVEQRRGIDRATYIAILHHDPKLDDAALEVAFASETPYIGAMGSRRAQAKRRERLEAAGISEDQLERVSAPIGLDIGALGSEETALSIMAEIISVRNGHGGSRLSEAKGRIHEAV